MGHQPSSPNSRPRTIDVAAMLAAEREGGTDPLAFPAHQLLLEHESIDRVDIRALAAALPTAAAKAGVQTRALEQAVMARMPDDLVPKLRNVLAGKPMVERPRQASWRERHLSWNRWFGPKPWQQTRWPASKHFGRKAMADVDKAYLRTDRAYEALRPYVCPVQFRAEIQKEPHFRDYMIGLVGLYANVDTIKEELDRTGGVSDVVKARATMVLTNWIEDWTAAKSLSSEKGEAFVSEYWDIGIDAAVCAMPSEHWWKLGVTARSCFAGGAHWSDPDVAAADREANELVRKAYAKRDQQRAGT